MTKFLSHIATERDVAVATQQQALLIYTHVQNRGGRGVVSPVDAVR